MCSFHGTQALIYDFLVLVLSTVGLSKRPSKSPLRKRLRAQGLVYFVIAVITYIPPAVGSLHSAPCHIFNHDLGLCAPQCEP